MATDDRDTLAEITSIDLLYAVLDRIVSEAGRSMASFIAADEAKLAIWRPSCRRPFEPRAAAGDGTGQGLGHHADHREDGDDREHAGCLDVPIMAASLDWSRALQSRSIVP
jgi:conjugative transfer pilus assembly protein TraH